MIEFGNTLRAAREAKGYTVAQIAEMTHLAPSTVEELEREDFSRIAAPIYGRGFVKLYCEAVGLAPKPLVDEFMEIYNGNRDTIIRERPVEQKQTAPEPVIPEPEPPRPDIQVQEAPAPAIDETQGGEEIAEPTGEPDLFTQSPATFPLEQDASPVGLARYAAPISQTRDLHKWPSGQIPASFWRIAALSVAALAVLVLLVLGARALYHATRTVPPPPDNASKPQEAPKTASTVQQPAAAVVATPASSPKAPSQPTKRECQSIPPLYID